MKIPCLGKNEGFLTTAVEQKTWEVWAVFLSIIPVHGLAFLTENDPLQCICKYLFYFFACKNAPRQHKLSDGEF